MPVESANHTCECKSVQECSSLRTKFSNKTNNQPVRVNNCRSLLSGCNNQAGCHRKIRRRGKKRAKEKQGNYRTASLHKHVCLCVPIAPYLVHSPKGLIILGAGSNTKAASLYLCPSSFPQRTFETQQIYLFVSFCPCSDQSDITLFEMHTSVGAALP